ncbi:MAG TPA: hypothetical protein DEG43_03535 [Acidimicrobiaceae bacterium]|jgi:hypothetical protein|nr:hypothetical protein [Acidimicrobiaceae bacterium]
MSNHQAVVEEMPESNPDNTVPTVANEDMRSPYALASTSPTIRWRERLRAVIGLLVILGGLASLFAAAVGVVVFLIGLKLGT